jgi:hypothetical protein
LTNRSFRGTWYLAACSRQGIADALKRKKGKEKGEREKGKLDAKESRK